MTLALTPETGAVPLVRARGVLTLPGLTERLLVIATSFIFVHETPKSWFLDRTGDTSEFSNPMLVVIELALIAVAFARVAGSIDHLITMVRTEPLPYLYTGLTFASLFWSADPALTFRRGLVFVAVTLYASYLVMRFSLDQIIRLLAAMFAISVVANFFFIFALPAYGVSSGGDWTGLFGQKNALGYTAALGLPALIVAARSYRPLRPVFYLTTVGLAVLLVGSQSKTMLVAGFLPVVLMAVYHGFRGRRTLRGAVLVSLVGSATLTVAFATANIALLAKWLDKDVTLTGRIPLWQNLWPVALEHPILGHGFGATFDGYFSPIHEVWIQNIWNPSHAHNALLQIWLEIGIFGVLLYVAVFLRAVIGSIKVVAVVPGAVGLWPLTFLTTTMLMSITETGVGSQPLGWMMFMVAVLSTSLHLRHRSAVGFSNDPRAVAAPLR